MRKMKRYKSSYDWSGKISHKLAYLSISFSKVTCVIMSYKIFGYQICSSKISNIAKISPAKILLLN